MFSISNCQRPTGKREGNFHRGKPFLMAFLPEDPLTGETGTPQFGSVGKIGLEFGPLQLKTKSGLTWFEIKAVVD